MFPPHRDSLLSEEVSFISEAKQDSKMSFFSLRIKPNFGTPQNPSNIQILSYVMLNVLYYFSLCSKEPWDIHKVLTCFYVLIVFIKGPSGKICLETCEQMY